MGVVLSALLPDFLLLALGRALGRSVPEAVWAGVDRLNFQILFPALIFAAAVSSAPGMRDLAVLGLGAWAILGLGCALAWLARPLGPARFLDFAGMWQTAWRFNSALALVVVQILPPEHRALMPIVIGMAVPVANLMAVSALTRGGGFGLWGTMRQVAANPFFVASLSGIVISAAGISLPAMVMQALGKLSQAAIPLALLSIGAMLNWRALLRLDGFSAVLNGVKLVLLPAAAWWGGLALGLDPGPRAVLTIFAAIPTASAAHVLASVYGAERAPVATLIAQSTLLGCLTLPIWLTIVT